MSNADGEEWRDLMPNNGDGRFNFVYSWIDIAIYRRPENVQYFEAWVAALGLITIPVVVLSVLYTVFVAYELATGAMTIAGLIEMFEAGRASTPQPREILLYYVEFLIELPFYLGLIVLVKALLSLRGRFR